VNIELDGIPLIRTESNQAGGIIEIRNVSNITTSDRRSMVEHEIPGMEGNVFQNLGRSPVRISFDGTLRGKAARGNLETIRSKFKQGVPLPFNSDISGATDVTKVLIEDMRIDEVAGVTERYRYSIALREYKEPPPEPTMPPSQDDKAKEWAEKVAEETVESINYITGKVVDLDGNPRSGVLVHITSDEGEFTVETNEEGIYRTEELPPMKYKVTVDSEGYEGIVEEVLIGKRAKEEKS